MPSTSARDIQELRLLMGSAKDPQGRVFAQLGDALRRAGELAEARHVLEEGLEEHPHFTPGHLAMAWLLLEAGEMDGARSAFQRTVELDGENPLGLFGLGTILDAQGEPSGASLVAQARALYHGVEDVAPRLALTMASLPFMTLEELAPEGAEDVPIASLDSLPFASLAELAPDEGDEADDLPFMALSELAPSEPAVLDRDEPAPAESALGASAEEGLPLVPLAELAPDPSALGPSGEGSFPGLPGSEDDPVAEEAPADATPITRTMAELLLSQGRSAQALAVYDQLIEQSPGSDALRERRAEIAREASGAGGVVTTDEALHPAFAMSHPPEAAPSPFDPAVDEGDESPEVAQDQGDTAAGYFGGLLSWSPPEDGSGPNRGA